MPAMHCLHPDHNHSLGVLLLLRLIFFGGNSKLALVLYFLGGGGWVRGSGNADIILEVTMLLVL